MTGKAVLPCEVTPCDAFASEGMTHTHQRDKTLSTGPTSMLQPRLTRQGPGFTSVIQSKERNFRTRTSDRYIDSCRSGLRSGGGPPYHWFPPRHKPRPGQFDSTYCIVHHLYCRKLTPAVLHVVPSFFPPSWGAISYRVLHYLFVV